MQKQLLLILLLIIVGNQLPAQTILGIDVSHYQGTINWQQVYISGKVFAYAKATEGYTVNDATFNTYMANGINAGVVMGAYHFARPDNNSAIDEANHFLSIAGSYIGQGFLPPALDLEASTTTFDATTLTTWVQTWMTTVKNRTGVTPIIYTNSYYAGYLKSTLNTYKLWIAKPDGNVTSAPTALGIWNTWAIKQYSWTGTVAGINPVDLNVFNGTITDFNNLIGKTTATCSAPSNLQMTATQNSVVLTWDNSTNVSNLQLKYKEAASPIFSTPVQLSATTKTYTISNLTCGTAYNVIIVSNCTDSTNFFISGQFNTSKCLVNTNDIQSLQNLLLYPNPNNGLFSIEFELTESKNIELNIYNSIGQQIFNKSETKFIGKYNRQINLAEISSGVYFVVIGIDNKKIVKSIVID